MTIRFTVKEAPDSTTTFTLNARRALDNSVMIFDHKEIDIVLMPNKNKVVAFAKDEFNEEVYGAQDRLLNSYVTRGVIQFDSVQGGNVYSSMEAIILESSEVNPYDTTLLMISKFINEERPLAEFEKAWNDEEEKRLTDPGPEDSTDWDPEKFHDTRQGSVPNTGVGYGISGVYRL